MADNAKGQGFPPSQHSTHTSEEIRDAAPRSNSGAVSLFRTGLFFMKPSLIAFRRRAVIAAIATMSAE